MNIITYKINGEFKERIVDTIYEAEKIFIELSQNLAVSDIRTMGDFSGFFLSDVSSFTELTNAVKTTLVS